MSPRKIIIIIIVIVSLVGSAIGSYVLMASHQPSKKHETTITGTITCLPHKNPDLPHTMECAIGLRDDTGKFYELKNIGNIDTNKRVSITGSVQAPTNTQYDTVGAIEITKLEIR